MVSEKISIARYQDSSQEVHQDDRSDRKNGLTIMGFLLFLTGAVLFAVGLADLLSHIDNLLTVMLLLGGLMLYKAGRKILQHCATLKVKRERRGHIAL